MTTITTDDCKEFLVSTYLSEFGITTLKKDWKRTRKYLNNEGVVSRDFDHRDIGTVTILENSGSLELVLEGQFGESKKYYKTFSKNETSTAIKLMSKIIEYRMNDDDEDKEEELLESSKWEKYKHAIPSQFTFYFPDGVYENVPENVTDGLNTKFVLNSGESLNVMFVNRNPDGEDLEIQDVLKMTDILPEWLDFADEEHVVVPFDSLDDECQKMVSSMTVKDVANFLFDMGFEYEEGSYDCLFSKEMYKYIEELKQNIS